MPRVKISTGKIIVLVKKFPFPCMDHWQISYCVTSQAMSVYWCFHCSQPSQLTSLSHRLLRINLRQTGVHSGSSFSSLRERCVCAFMHLALVLHNTSVWRMLHWFTKLTMMMSSLQTYWTRLNSSALDQSSVFLDQLKERDICIKVFVSLGNAISTVQLPHCKNKAHERLFY